MGIPVDVAYAWFGLVVTHQHLLTSYILEDFITHVTHFICSRFKTV